MKHFIISSLIGSWASKKTSKGKPSLFRRLVFILVVRRHLRKREEKKNSYAE